MLKHNKTNGVLCFGIAALLCSVTRRPLLYAETARQFCASLQEEKLGSPKDALSGRSEIDLKLESIKTSFFFFLCFFCFDVMLHTCSEKQLVGVLEEETFVDFGF